MRFLPALLLLLSAFSRAAAAQDQPIAPAPVRHGVDELDYAEVRGINYLPVLAASPYQFWKNYDAVKVELDLARARRIGFNSVRVFLSYAAYEDGPSVFIGHLTTFIESCWRTGVTVMPVLFDSWGIEMDPNYQVDFIARTDDPHKIKREPTLTSYKRMMERPDAYRIDPKNFERRMRFIAEKLIPERQIPLSKDPSVVFWGDWFSSPGPSRLGKKEWPRCGDYLEAVIAPLKDDPIIVAWDIMNEPDVTRVFNEPADSHNMYLFAWAMIEAARALKPHQPLTVGASNGYAGARVFAGKEDLVSLHYFEGAASGLSAQIREARRHDKVVMVTATGATLFPKKEEEAAEEGQLALVRRIVSQLEREKTGYYLWQLNEGASISPWTALLRPDGQPKAAAEWLKKHWEN